MNKQTLTIIEGCAHASKAGTAHFGDVVKALTDAGVESYYADYRGNVTTYYLPNGDAHSIALVPPATPIGEAFDTAAIQAAIKAAQQGEVMFPEFLARSRAAGCVGYMVWLAGRHVTYFGRLGQTHVEPFPD